MPRSPTIERDARSGESKDKASTSAAKTPEAAPKKPRSKPRRTRGKPNHVDIHVGTRVRQRRTLLGLSQEKLAEALGLTFQQVQKYERGANRIGAGRLYELGRALDVPVSYFFNEMENAADQATETHGDDPLNRRETLLLVRAYYAIPQDSVRRNVLDLLKSLGSGGEVNKT